MGTHFCSNSSKRKRRLRSSPTRWTNKWLWLRRAIIQLKTRHDLAQDDGLRIAPLQQFYFCTNVVWKRKHERTREGGREREREEGRETTDRSHSYLSTNNQWLFNRAHSHILGKARIIERDEEYHLSRLLVKDNNVDKRHWRDIDNQFCFVRFLYSILHSSWDYLR